TPCTPVARQQVAAGGPGTKPGGMKPPGNGADTPAGIGPGASSGVATAPTTVAAPPTFTAMPDGDYMVGYVAPNASAQTYAKVKLIQAATPAAADFPHD